MPEVIPRWEWRTFGSTFGTADARFASLTAEKVQVSDETYLLSPATDANVKVRDALMDIKALEQVGTAGLEQWRPVMKATFPLPPDAVAAVCAALGVPVPPAADEPTTLDRLRRELTHRGVRAVAVHKLRARYTLHGCMAEVTEVVADGKPVRSIAIESENAARVVAAVRAMGLEALENVSYPRGLKALLGIGPRGS